MTWLPKIRTILGKFWTFLFHDYDFISAVEYILVVIATFIYAKYTKWRKSKVSPIDGISYYNSILPFVILLDSTTCHAKVNSFSDILNGKEIGGVSKDSEWVIASKDTVIEPFILQDHIIECSNVFINGVDFKYLNNSFLFYTDPREMGLPSVSLLSDTGEVKLYYRLFAYSRKKPIRNDYIDAFIPGLTTDNYAMAWDMYHKGTTIYNLKGLLASATGDTISDIDATVTDIWKEQNTWCVLTDKKLFTCTSSPRVSIGTQLHKGTLIAGNLKLFTGQDSPTYADIPGIKVRVDDGELIAYNYEQDAIIYNNTNILPLQGTASIMSAYASRCWSLSTNKNVPSIDIPNRVNPYSFIMKSVRKGTSVAVSLSVKAETNIAPIINCIRKCISTSSMLNIYIKAESDTYNLTDAKFSASAGMGAVATVVSVGVNGTYAEAKTLQ